jgi:hypothetical protein
LCAENGDAVGVHEPFDYVGALGDFYGGPSEVEGKRVSIIGEDESNGGVAGMFSGGRRVGRLWYGRVSDIEKKLAFWSCVIPSDLSWRASDHSSDGSEKE